MPIAAHDGRMAVPGGPGLGVELDGGAPARHEMRSGEVQR